MTSNTTEQALENLIQKTLTGYSIDELKQESAYPKAVKIRKAIWQGKAII